MLKFLIVALMVGVVLNGIMFQLEGISEAHAWSWVHHLPKGLEALVAIGILTEATLNGAHQKKEYWKSRARQLGYLLVFTLGLRLVFIYFAATAVGGLEEPAQIAGGLTATDPAATGISLSLVNAADNAFDAIFFTLSVESMVNDAEGLVAFNIFKDPGYHLIWAVAVTVLLAGFVAASDGYARWKIRRSGWAHVARIETISVLAIYISGLTMGVLLGASLIGLAAVAGIIGDFVVHDLPHEAGYRAHEHERERLNDLWNNVGLSAVFGVVVLFLPWRQILGDWEVIQAALTILLAIFTSRVIGEGMWLVLRSKKVTRRTWGEAAISSQAAVCMLGVPSIVGFEMYLSGHHHDGIVVLAAVMLSWLTVATTVPFIGWANRNVSSE